MQFWLTRLPFPFSPISTSAYRPGLFLPTSLLCLVICPICFCSNSCLLSTLDAVRFYPILLPLAFDSVQCDLLRILELALLNSAPRAATVRPLPGSGRLRVATLGEKAFTRLLGPVVEILTRRAERNYGSASASAAGSALTSPTRTAHDERERGAGPREGVPPKSAGAVGGIAAGGLKGRSSRERMSSGGEDGRRERKKSEDVVMDG